MLEHREFKKGSLSSDIYVFEGGGGYGKCPIVRIYVYPVPPCNTQHHTHCPRHHTRLRWHTSPQFAHNLRIISQYFLTLKLCSRSCCFSSSKAFACSCSAINFVLTSWKETIKLETFPRNKLTSGLNIRRHIEEEAPFLVICWLAVRK